MELIKENMSDTYGIIGCSRDGRNAITGEWNTVLYRKDRFDLIKGDTFWLSETPDTEVTKLDYHGCYRICTWTLLKDKITGKILMFNNTHLQNSLNHVEIREKQMKILIDYLTNKLGLMKDYPFFMTGDFNATSGEPAYAVAVSAMKDSATTCEKNSSAVDFTFHNYGNDNKHIIDYCFHSPKDITVHEYKILDEQFDGYVSDHYGILVTATVE
jgi:endonuclease/exonuclease/phosphatase family metal-dependent hydrolase